MRAASQVDEREDDPHQGDHPVAELDEGVVALLRVRPVAAPRPVLAPEPGAREPHEGARGDDEEEGDTRRGGEPEEPRSVTAPRAR